MVAMTTVDIRDYKQADPHQQPSMRDGLIRRYMPLIKLVANRIIRRLPPQIEVTDLINSGVLGLIDAIEKFDPGRDIKFETYAEFRIRGAILDELRSLDWVPRSIRQRINELQLTMEKLENKLKRAATDEEIAKEMRISLEDYQDLIKKASGVALLSFDDLGYGRDTGVRGGMLEYYKEPHAENLISLLNLQDVRGLLASAIDELTEKERHVVSLYYFDELTMKEIGMVLEITESRVSQIHNKAILRLKTKLRRNLREDADDLL